MANGGGYLYAIGTLGAPWVKIGSTQGPVEKRLKGLQTGHPLPLKILARLHVETDMRRIEAYVHTFLAKARQRGEWFDVQISDDAQLEQLVAQAIQYVAEQEAQKRRDREARDQARALRNCQHVRNTSDAPNAMDMDRLGKRLRAQRDYAGLSQMDLASLTGIIQADISLLERGKKRAVWAATLLRLAETLGCSLDYLACRTDNPQVNRDKAADGRHSSWQPEPQTPSQPPDTWASPPPARPATPGWPPVVPPQPQPQPQPRAGETRPW